MADHQQDDTLPRDHAQTYDGFMKFTKVSTVVVVLLLALLAWALV